eukprot:scaffold2868_cov348-Pavlova_lutheri.AAC.20
MDNGSVAQGRSIAFSPSHVSVTRAPFICLHSRWWYVSNTSSGIGTLDRPYPPTSAEWTPTQIPGSFGLYGASSYKVGSEGGTFPGTTPIPRVSRSVVYTLCFDTTRQSGIVEAIWWT